MSRLGFGDGKIVALSCKPVDNQKKKGDIPIFLSFPHPSIDKVWAQKPFFLFLNKLMEEDICPPGLYMFFNFCLIRFLF